MSDPTLASAFDALQRAGFAALVWDRRFRVVGVTTETLRIFRLGSGRLDPPLGRHMFSSEWVTLMTGAQGGTTFDSQRELFREAAPALLEAEGGDAQALCEAIDPRLHDLLEGVEPARPEPVWTTHIDATFGDRTTPIDLLVVTLRDADGRAAGGATISKPGVGGAVLAMLATGDAELFERMLRLLEPARRSAAILFADLESSTALARRLSTKAYFALVRRLTSLADQSVVGAGGIVGKHVGDGITAFFLTEDAGSESAAARACIETARALREDAAAAADRSGLDPGQVVLRTGLHWGASPYIGRLLTSGRTEVTALGDEVNEGARIEACAPGDQVLASKTLIERLDPGDARALGLAPAGIEYTQIVDLAAAPEKARRDAPALSVTRL
jgi:class 3 adenylate cyclase